MSQAPDGPENYTQAEPWADDIAAIIAQLGLRHPILVGWSYGGFVICDYVRAHAFSWDRASWIMCRARPPKISRPIFRRSVRSCAAALHGPCLLRITRLRCAGTSWFSEAPLSPG